MKINQTFIVVVELDGVADNVASHAQVAEMIATYFKGLEQRAQEPTAKVIKVLLALGLDAAPAPVRWPETNEQASDYWAHRDERQRGVY